ncbi:HPP family protein [Oceanobacter mangrovi]|uniref:HPP family protein n=1 Tax=Oceanobacter mangrovi TaxID=2862510 RepID=UPI001FEA0139|nr:HPP family protein [Oceanobacter mangrovi]
MNLLISRINTSGLITALLAGMGAAACITALSYIGELGHGLWLMAPFGATMVILFGLPASPLAQPRNIVLGHLLTTAVGLGCLTLFGVHGWSLGLAVGLAVMLMMLTDTLHPPAGANPLLAMLTGASWHFLVTPVAVGVFTIVLFGYGYHRWVSGKPWPQRWF